MTELAIPQLNVKCLEPFKILYDIPADCSLLIFIGGRGGSKTYEVSKAVAYHSTIGKKRIQILRDEKAHIKESILNEVLMRYDTANTSGFLDGYYTRMDTGIKDIATGRMSVFTKGFRASSSSQRANLKSVSDIDIAVIEEAEDIRDQDKYNTFADSIRKPNSFIIIILNTPDINHWIVKRYFNLMPSEKDGYFKLQPKDIKGVYTVQTSYKDNPYLPAKTVEQYEGYGDTESHLYNEHYYLTAIKGYASTGLKGQIFKNYSTITLDEFNEVDAREVIGQDFGTASPAAMVNVKIEGNNLYLDELNYLGMGVKEIGIKYCELGFDEKQLIIADGAEPKTIQRLYYGFEKFGILDNKDLELYPQLRKGFNIIPAKKGQGSIMSGIGLMLGMKIFVTERSVNLQRELVSYCYAVDKNGNSLDRPIDNWNHLIDAIRYVVIAKGSY